MMRRARAPAAFGRLNSIANFKKTPRTTKPTTKSGTTEVDLSSVLRCKFLNFERVTWRERCATKGRTEIAQRVASVMATSSGNRGVIHPRRRGSRMREAIRTVHSACVCVCGPRRPRGEDWLDFIFCSSTFTCNRFSIQTVCRKARLHHKQPTSTYRSQTRRA